VRVRGLASVELEHAVVTVTDPRDIATYLRLFAKTSQAARSRRLTTHPWAGRLGGALLRRWARVSPQS
jgi:hypothetical protein